MRLRLHQFRPRTGPYEHRVVQPRQPLRHTSLRAPEPIGLLLGDHDGLNQLAGLFSFAAYSRHTVVHVPLRTGLPPDEGVGEPVDLVLAHHTLGLRPSKWPEVRRKLVNGTPLTVRTDEARTARDATSWREHGERAGSRDELRHATHARTFFLFGERDVFAQAATSFAHAAGWGPRQKGVVKGHSALMAALPTLVQGLGGGHPIEALICFNRIRPTPTSDGPGAQPSVAVSRRTDETSDHHPPGTARIHRVQGHPTSQAPGPRRTHRPRPAPGRLPRSGRRSANRRTVETRRLLTALAGPPADTREPGPLP